MLAYWDARQVCRFANKAYEEWFRRSLQDLLGTTMRDLLGPLYEKNLPYIEGALAGERQVFERAIPRPRGGAPRHSLATYIPHFVDGRVVGIFVHVADVEPLKKLELELIAAREKAEQLATHDYLTGLPNRVLLDDRLDEALGRAERAGDKVYFLSIDVDNFKAINDKHGHAAGDSFLVQLASRIKACVRAYDTVTRVGGDEFLVLASTNPPEEGVEGLAKRILEAARKPCPLADALILPTLSIGIAAYPQHGSTKEALMLASDRALYVSKRGGRNSFTVAE
jgi:diguanylate cyclase (GGDEF)-like protein